MPLKPNQVVTINFTLKDSEGTVIDTTEGSNPFSFLSGNNQILQKLEEEIGGMIIGGKKHITLEPGEAYGEYKDSMIQTANRADFPEGEELNEGSSFVADTPDGHQMPFTITGVEGDDITLDFNHPLAGQTLEFDVELLDIRDATSEELAHGHAHGPDGHHHH